MIGYTGPIRCLRLYRIVIPLLHRYPYPRGTPLYFSASATCSDRFAAEVGKTAGDVQRQIEDSNPEIRRWKMSTRARESFL